MVVEARERNHMLRVRHIRIPAVHINGPYGKYREAAQSLNDITVGEVVMIEAGTPADLKKARKALMTECAKKGITPRFLEGEHRVELVERRGTIGLWRESRGHWAYVLKHAEAHPYKPTAADFEKATA
jgi:hypothetical protein